LTKGRISPVVPLLRIEVIAFAAYTPQQRLPTAFNGRTIPQEMSLSVDESRPNLVWLPYFGHVFISNVTWPQAW